MAAAIIILVVLILFGVIFLRSYPPFGAKSSKDDVQKFQRSPHFNGKTFFYPQETKSFRSEGSKWSMLRDLFQRHPHSRPHKPIPIEPLDAQHLQDEVQTWVTWFGHSTLLLRIEGKTLLIDPMFGTTPSPFPRIGSKRYSTSLPIDPAQLPKVDAVLLSHDHYDHLDYGSILKLKNKVTRFIVPLGVGSHLQRWGVHSEQISELDWWDEMDFEGLTLACTPARHFSGRSLFDGGTKLWCSWVIAGKRFKLFFSGDSGYGPHFKEIGAKYGPFEMTLMECGQYDVRWPNVHMMPEDTVQAQIDVQGKLMIPIHWAAFTLAFHDWTEPIERVVAAAKRHSIQVSTPKIGETVAVGSSDYPVDPWWR